MGQLLPGVLGLAVLNGVLAAWNGYVGMDRSLRVPRTSSITMVLILVACGALVGTLQSRKLTTLDRAALFGFLLALAMEIISFPSLMGFGLMLSCLAVAWGANLIRQRRSARHVTGR